MFDERLGYPSLRIEYPDAWYHVESAEMWNVITACCMVLTHYHVLIQTPDANLSRFIRHVDGVYTQRFNRSCQYDGQLFRGRYKSILIDSNQESNVDPLS